MAGRDASFTHKHWAVITVSLRDAVDSKLAPAASHVVASLKQMQAGKTQLAQGAHVVQALSELGTAYSRLFARYDTLFRGVNEAVRAAGLDEVAARKEYNRSS